MDAKSKLGRAALFAVGAALATGCVTQGRYDEAVAQTEITRAELHKTSTALEQKKAEADQRAKDIARLEALLNEASKTSSSELATRDARLADLARALERSRTQNAMAEQRAALFRSIAAKLQKQVDAGSVSVVVRDGRMVLQLPDDVLFDSGRTEIKPAGREALEAVAFVLAAMPERHFQIAGHTDNVPIHNERFASNWELSSGRALRVLDFLVKEGVKPAELSAAGYADVDPVAPNDTAGGRKKNRRTEITLQPNIDELIAVPTINPR